MTPIEIAVTFGTVAAVCSLVLSFSNWRQLRSKRRNPAVAAASGGPALQGGPFCNNCGQRTDPSPVTAVVMPPKTYFVYKCSTCREETMTTREPGV